MEKSRRTVLPRAQEKPLPKLLKCLPGVIGKAKVAADDMLQQPCRRLLGELQDHFTLFDRGQCHQLKSLKEQLHNQQRLGKIVKSLSLASHAAQPITFYLDTPARSLVLLAKMPLRIAAMTWKGFSQQLGESSSHFCFIFTFLGLLSNSL